MRLTFLDWSIVLISLLICFGPAVFFGRRAGQNTSEFFASGRAVPWWLAGISMVATTFSADTPNLVTDFVRAQRRGGELGLVGLRPDGCRTVFFYARLWRRSGVLTDLEFYELRYSGSGGVGAARLPGDLPGSLLQLSHHGVGQSGRLQDRQHPVRAGSMADACCSSARSTSSSRPSPGCGACSSST